MSAMPRTASARLRAKVKRLREIELGTLSGRDFVAAATTIIEARPAKNWCFRNESISVRYPSWRRLRSTA